MIEVVCAIIKKGDKILVTQRSEKMKLPLKWEFPGGKLEKGEDEVKCIKRELREELNIEVRVLEKLTNSAFDYGDIQINLIPYIVEYVSGEITLLEHAECRWIESNFLLGLDWADADLPIVIELINT
jgi:8-oxo-dGTP diphosphatase